MLCSGMVIPESDPMPARGPDDAFRRRTVFVAFVALLFVIAASASWALRTLLLMTFLAAILAVILRHAGNRVSGWTGIRPRWSVLLVALLIVVAFAAGIVFLGATLADQVRQLVQRLPAAVEAAQGRLGDHPWLSEAWARVREGLSLPDPSDAVGGAGRILAGLSSALGYVGLALVGALFLALEPALYRDGILRRVPVRHRAFAGELLDDLETTTISWLGGQLILMASIGILVGLGLWAIGVPYALALGVLAGLLEFIPYLGPILSATPAILLAFTVGPTTALWTAGLIVVVQQVENNVLQPVVQKSSVEIAPVLLLVVLFAMGQLFGVAGLVAATPLLAIVIVIVRRVYVERLLEGGPARDGAVAARTIAR